MSFDRFEACISRPYCYLSCNLGILCSSKPAWRGNTESFKNMWKSRLTVCGQWPLVMYESCSMVRYCVCMMIGRAGAKHHRCQPSPQRPTYTNTWGWFVWYGLLLPSLGCQQYGKQKPKAIAIILSPLENLLFPKECFPLQQQQQQPVQNSTHERRIKAVRTKSHYTVIASFSYCSLQITFRSKP